MQPTVWPRWGGAARASLAILLLLGAIGCATAPTPPGGGDVATEAEWRALATPRVAPLPGAARLSVTEVELAGRRAWSELALPLTPELAVEELIVAGLLRRRDVHFVERRRFVEAAAAERAGLPRPDGAPAVGVSPGAELLASVVRVDLPTGESALEVRLTDARTGAVEATTRVAIPRDAPPLSTARASVGGIVGALDRLGRLPEWEDPIPFADGTTEGPPVDGESLSSFLRGVVAETTWRWETARRWYQAALGEPAFFEAEAALARAARLRAGGTLGES